MDHRDAQLAKLLDETDELTDEIKTIEAGSDALHWQAGRLCFEIFGRGATTETGLSIAELAKQQGWPIDVIEKALAVYRVLGEWHERQTVPVPFNIAKLTLQHAKDGADAERLMELWRNQDRPDADRWQAYFHRGNN